MRQRATKFAVLAALLTLFCQPAWGQDAKGNPAEREALEKQREEWVAAYNKGDAKAVAEIFASDADYIRPSGRVTHGRPKIKNTFRGFLSRSKEVWLKTGSDLVRFLKPDIAIVHGRWEMLRPEGRGRYTAVCVKQEGKWQLLQLARSVSPPPQGK